MKSLTVILFVLFLFGCQKQETDSTEPQERTYAIAEVATRLGNMYFWLYDETPNHKAKFMELAKENHYDQFTFNRVIQNFVVQGGCPDSVQYFENSPFLLEPEFLDTFKHTYGALGMGRDDNPQKLSNACQFYIVNKETGLPQLDGDYMIFGKIVKGKDVLELIESQKTNPNDQPIEQIPLNVSILQFSEKTLADSFDLVL